MTPTMHSQRDIAPLPLKETPVRSGEQRMTFNCAFRRLLNTRVRAEMNRFLAALTIRGYWVEVSLDNRGRFPLYIHQSYLVYGKGNGEPTVLSVVGQFDDDRVCFYCEFPEAATYRLSTGPEDFREEDLCNWLHEVFSI